MENNSKTKDQILKEIDQLKAKLACQNKADNTLLVNEQFMTSLFESVQEGICVLNPDMTIRHVNGLMNSWYKDNIPLIGKKCYEVYHNTDKPCKPCPSLRCLESGNTESDIIPGLPESPIKWIELFSYPLKDLNTGEVLGVVEYVRDITEREKTREKLYKSEEKFKSIFEFAPYPYFILDLKGTLTDGNSAAEKMTGYKKSELIGKNILKAGLISSSQIPLAAARVAAYATGKTQETIEFSLIKKDKSRVEIEVSTSFIILDKKRFTLNIARDITPRKLSDQALKDSEYLLRESQKIAHIGSYVMDIQSGAWVGSEVLDELFGIDGSFIRDVPGWLQIIHPEDKARMENYFKNSVLKNHETFNKEYRIERINDQQERWVHGTGDLGFNKDGNPVKMIGTIQDITERKQGEEELSQHRQKLEETVKQRTIELENQSKKLEESQRALTFLLEDVNEARVELEKTNKQITLANKEMESFTYSVSHDLRAPLRAILGFSNKFSDIYEKKVDKEGKRLLNVINENTKKMGMLIDDLLDFSRMGRSEMRKVKVDIKGLVYETWNEQKDQFSDRKIELTIKDLPMAKGDRNMLRQVLFNLLSNAAKFSRNKKISKIEVGFEENETETIYYVKDNGAGFEMKYINKLFLVFQRLHSDREFEGTGVGLAIVQRVINRHDGRVWAKSTINKGATVYFSLPK